jgi:hypothetical protein
LSSNGLRAFGEFSKAPFRFPIQRVGVTFSPRRWRTYA